MLCEDPITKSLELTNPKSRVWTMLKLLVRSLWPLSRRLNEYIKKTGAPPWGILYAVTRHLASALFLLAGQFFIFNL